MLTPTPSLAETTLTALRNCLGPATETACLPPACYADDDHLKAEMTNIFQRKWVSIGRADRFKATGDFETMDIGGVPVILLRDSDGTLRAYANSCRHRGARLLNGEGNCRGIKCPFHGWAYKLDGRLAGAAHMEGAAGFDKRDNGLIEFRTGEALGFAFLCLDPNAPELADQLGDFAQFHSPWPISDLVSTRRRMVEVPCNWKAFLDVFNEYYHLAYIHPDTVNAMYSDPLDGDVTSGEFATQYGPISGSGGVLEDEQEHALPHIPGLTGEAPTGVRYSWVFPNLTFAAARMRYGPMRPIPSMPTAASPSRPCVFQGNHGFAAVRRKGAVLLPPYGCSARRRRGRAGEPATRHGLALRTPGPLLTGL